MRVNDRVDCESESGNNRSHNTYSQHTELQGSAEHSLGKTAITCGVTISFIILEGLNLLPKIYQATRMLLYPSWIFITFGRDVQLGAKYRACSIKTLCSASLAILLC